MNGDVLNENTDCHEVLQIKNTRTRQARFLNGVRLDWYAHITCIRYEINSKDDHGFNLNISIHTLEKAGKKKKGCWGTVSWPPHSPDQPQVENVWEYFKYLSSICRNERD